MFIENMEVLKRFSIFLNAVLCFILNKVVSSLLNIYYGYETLMVTFFEYHFL